MLGDKIRLFILFLFSVNQLFSVDLMSSTNSLGSLVENNFKSSILGDLFDNFNKLSGGAVGMCYINSNYKIDVCSQFLGINNLQKNMCSILPDLGSFGYQKKSNFVGINGAGLNSFCRVGADKLNNVISSANIYDSEYKIDKNIPLPNGKSVNEYYSEIANPKAVFQTSKNTYAKDAFSKGDQGRMRIIVNAGKISNTNSLNDIDINSLKAPNDYNDYLEQRDGLAATVTNDLIIASPANVSGVLAQKLNGKSGASAELIANQYVAEINEKIDAGTPKRIGLAVDLARNKGNKIGEEDIVIPTQEYIKYFRIDQRPQLVAQIQFQIKREAYIQSKIVIQDESRKNLVALAAQKALIMNEKFDEEKAQQEINSLIK